MKSRTQSILSCLGFLWVVAFIYGPNGDCFSVYRLRQGFGLTITMFHFSFVPLFFEFFSPETEPLSAILILPFLLLSSFGIIHVIKAPSGSRKIFGKHFKFIE